MAAEGTVTMTKSELQQLLEGVAKILKEPTEKEKVQMEKERQDMLRKEGEARALHLSNQQKEEARRKNCAHQRTYNGRLFHGWVGQVNSDSFVVPICKYCRSEWPKFSSALLPDNGKNGVNFEEWNYCNAELLSTLHKQSFPEGCGVQRCFVCNTEKAKKTVA